MPSALRVSFLAFFLLISIPPNLQADGAPRILAMGDSLMASHKVSGRAISHAIGDMVGTRVVDRSVAGARIIYKLPITGSMGLSISRQYRPGNWDWIVLNGGGNDLLFGCGCRKCDAKITKLIAANGSRGEIPELIRKLRRTGARVVYVGYLRSPGTGSPIEQCRDEGNELERRIGLFAKTDPGVHFVSLADMVPRGDRTFHAADMIHPSLKGSRAIGMRIGRLITK